MTTTTELKPCPFCGSRPNLHSYSYNRHAFECKKCHAGGPERKTDIDAECAWNTRAEPDYEVSSGCVFNDLKTCPPDGRCINAEPAPLPDVVEAVLYKLEAIAGGCQFDGNPIKDCDARILRAHITNLEAAIFNGKESCRSMASCLDRRDERISDLEDELKQTADQLRQAQGKISDLRAVASENARLKKELETYRRNDPSGVYSTRTDKETD